MDFASLVFYCFAVLMLSAGLGVVLSSNPVYSALFLVFAFISSAIIWLLLHAEFLAIALILIYVGAVMVLFLFVLMMLDVNFERLREGFWRYLPLAILLAAVLVWQITSVIGDESFLDSEAFVAGAPEDNTRALGSVLYTRYVYPFELAAVLLLVAILSAVALTLRRRKSAKSVDAGTQVSADPSERVRLVSLPAAVATDDADSHHSQRAKS